jgi:hypothetical protein
MNTKKDLSNKGKITNERGRSSVRGIFSCVLGATYRKNPYQSVATRVNRSIEKLNNKGEI